MVYKLFQLVDQFIMFHLQNQFLKPSSIQSISVLYIAYILGTSAASPKIYRVYLIFQVAKLLNELDMQIVRHRDSSVKEELKRYIPIPASFGGKCIRALTILADFLGAIGPGTVILLSVTIIYGYLETLKKEKEQGTLELF